MELQIRDVRAAMPNFQAYKDWQRSGKILGVAVHHSGTADRLSGAPTGDAFSYFDYHVNSRGWTHGGYNYVITATGEIQYALDDGISAYHAGFKDPNNTEGLEFGQYWNNHYLAICLAGWFSDNRTVREADGRVLTIPNNFTSPSQVQEEALLALTQHLRQKYNIPVENVRGHRELAGNSTSCPGLNFDPAQFRAKLRAAEQVKPEPTPGSQPQVNPGEHVLILPDTDKYLDAAMAYIWKFQPDVSFAINEAAGRWKYFTAVGNEEDISESQLGRLRSGGAELVQRVGGDPPEAQTRLDELVASNLRFLSAPSPTPQPTPVPPPDAWPTYTVQPGDTLSLVARQAYGQSNLWRIIFDANRDILSDPGRVFPGQVLRIPPKPQ